MSKRRGPGIKAALALIPAFLVIAAVLSLFVIASGGKALVRTSAAGGGGASSPEPRPRRGLRVLSWNLRDCAATDAKTKERLAFHARIAEVLARLEPDVAAFQEVQLDGEKGGDIALLQVALAKAGWSMPYTATAETGGQDDLALFSRAPILDSRTVLQPGTSDPWPRPGLQVRIGSGGQALDLFVYHFKAMSDRGSESVRKAQARAAAGLLRQGMEGGGLSPYVIVAGDLNTASAGDRGSAGSTMGLLSLRDDADPANDFSDPIEDLRPQVPTFVDSRYASVLDHLLLSPGAARALKPGSALVFTDLPHPSPVPVSDHRPVLVELDLSGLR